MKQQPVKTWRRSLIVGGKSCQLRDDAFRQSMNVNSRVFVWGEKS